jgi:hypothetical protein
MLRAVRRRRIALAVAAMAPVLAGCGSSGPTDEQLVARTVTAFGRATAAKDYRSLCERILAPSLIEQLTQIGLPCEQALAKGLGSVRSPSLTLGAVTVEGDTATAEVRTRAADQAPSRDTLRLEKVRGAWRVASLTR